MKIAIIGYSGSGKSTLARTLGALHGLPVLHLDRVMFIENWGTRDVAQGQAMVAAFLEQPGWIVDGNYEQFLLKERLEQADLLVMMDFPRWRCLWRVYRRYRTYRGRTREDMGDGCEEKLDGEFLRWVVWEGRNKARRQRFRDTVARYQRKTVVLRTPRQVATFCARQAQQTKG